MLVKDIIITAIICLALVAVLSAIIVNMIRNKKKGKSACSCGCSSCSMTGICHKAKDEG